MPPEPITYIQRPVEVQPKTTAELIKEAEVKYGLKADILLKTLWCESHFEHEGLYGDNGLAYGIAQFHKPTFLAFEKESGMDLEYTDKEDQIELAGWAFANEKAWHWVCWKRIKGIE